MRVLIVALILYGVSEAVATTSGRLDDTSANLFGSCSRCRLFGEQMFRENSDGSCTNRCFIFKFFGRIWGFSCGKCDPPPEFFPDSAKFNTQIDLSRVHSRYRQTFIDAASRWDSVITTDIPDVDARGQIQGNSFCENVPSFVDDLFVCSSTIAIDGAQGILGQAGAEWIRSENLLPITGLMQFDTADVDNLVQSGVFDSVVLHEIGHVYGIADFFFEELGLSTNCEYDPNLAASREFQNATGCSNTTAIPLENDQGGDGTLCSHWDEECMQGELMTGFLSGGLELSRMTVGALEDLGYAVNYSQAQEFGRDKMNEACIERLCPSDQAPSNNTNVSSLQSMSIITERPPLRKPKADDQGLQAATAYGKAYLADRKQNRPPPSPFRGGPRYIGDKFVSVFYIDDNGEIRSLSIFDP